MKIIHNSKLKIQNSKGYVLISVLVIMMVLVTMTYFFSDALFAEQAISHNEAAANVTFNSAEAGTQEAVWRIQNDSTTRDTFLNTTSGVTTFNHSNGLMSGSSYTVIIQNTAKAAATITSTGLYQVGAKQAQRKITLNVLQNTATGPYTYNAGIFVCGPNSGDIYLHNLNLTYGAGYDSGSLIGCGNINIGNANISVNQDILANGTISTQNSNVTYGGIEQPNSPTSYAMPGIDVNSTASTSFKSMAQTQNQYYTSAQFATLIQTQTTFSGIVYVAGSGGITLKKNNLHVNGTLVSEGSISINNDTLTVNHTTGPSGLITLNNFSVNNATVTIEGLVYVGVQSAASTNANITVTGAILTHDFYGNNATLQLNFRNDWANETLSGGTSCGGGTTYVAADPKILRPNSDIDIALFPNNCTNRYDCVSDQSDATYVSALPGSGNRTATYGTPANSVPSNATNISVTDYIRIKTNNLASNAAWPLLRVNGAYYSNGAPNVSSVFTNFSTTWATNPNTRVPWTVSDLASTFPGVQTYVNSAVGLQVSEVWLVINYETPVVSGGGTCGSTESPVIKMQHWEEEY